MKADIDSEDSFYSINYKQEQEQVKPEKKYIKNDEKIGVISLIFTIAFVVYIIWTIIDTHAYGESDFVLEAKVNEADTDLDVTRFEISGESDKQICPSGQCTINLEHIFPFRPPSPDFMHIAYRVEFKVQDNQTNPNLGAKKKEFLEQFSASMIYCKVDDIIEDNGQEIYTCHDGSTTVTRTFDSRSWDYETIAIFDAKKNTLRAVGNYTGSR